MIMNLGKRSALCFFAEVATVDYHLQVSTPVLGKLLLQIETQGERERGIVKGRQIQRERKRNRKRETDTMREREES